MPQVPSIVLRQPGRDVSVIGGVTVPEDVRHSIDVEAVLNREYPAYRTAVEALAKRHGHLVIEARPPRRHRLDAMCIRDVALPIDDAIATAHFCDPHRREEVDGIDELIYPAGTEVPPGIRFVYHEVVPLNGRSVFEGGNHFMVQGGSDSECYDVLVAGIGVRGNHDALAQLRPIIDRVKSRRRRKRDLKLIPLETTELHVTSVLCPIGPRRVLLNPFQPTESSVSAADYARVLEKHGIEVLLVPEEDRRSRLSPDRASLAANVLWLESERGAPGGIVSHSANKATIAMLRSAGYDVEAVDMTNITERVEAGPDCLALKLTFRCAGDCWD